MADDELSRHLPLTPPVLCILLAVADRKRHGYAIMQEVRERTGGEVELLPGSLYSTIKRMLAAELIEELDGGDSSPDPRRRYYGITEHGREVAGAELHRMETLLRVGREKRLAQV